MQSVQEIQQTTVDPNARARFLDETIRGYAGISYVDSITKTVTCLNDHNRDFRDGNRGSRDATRAKAHFEAAGLARGPAAVLAFFLALGLRGKLGSVCTEDVSADAVRRTTGAPCQPRTYRRHLATLCRAGFLSKSLVPTGTRIQKSCGEWTSLKVCKVSLTPLARFLTAKKTYITLPRPTRPTIERDKRETGESLTISCLSLPDDLSKNDQRAPVVTKESVESPSGDKTTRPELAEPAQTVEQQTSTSASRKTADNAVPVSASESRASAPKTWRTARRTLLAELFAYFHVDPLRDELYRIAELQTDPFYPAAMVAALDWDPLVRRWMLLGWHDRRRALKNEVAPALRAFCDHLNPSEQTGDGSEIRRELAPWLAVVPALIPDSVPDTLRAEIDRERFRINALARQIHAGRVPLSALTNGDHRLIQQIGLFFR